MKIAKFWRSALAMSLVLTVMLSITGGTIAWFTDSVTSANNVIKAGNLDIELEYWNNGAYTPVTKDTKLFNKDALWEPGHTEVAYLKVTNKGSLALKYQLGVNVAGETVGKTKDNKDINLSEHLKFKVVESSASLVDTYKDNRAAAQAAAADGTALQNTYVVKNMSANADAHYLALIISMPTTVGNEANHDGANVPSIEMGVKLEATQLTEESDSFGNQYDRDAQYDLVPGAPAQDVYDLVKKLEKAQPGETITVNAGVYELDAPLTIPAGVTLKGAQAGVPGAQWAGAESANKTVLKVKDGEGAYVIHIKQDVGHERKNIVIDGIMIDGNGTAAAGIRSEKDSGPAMEGIQVRNSVVMNAKEGIILKNTVGVIAENNYVENVEGRAIAVTNYFNYGENAEEQINAFKPAYVRNNVIDGVTATANGAIHLENGSGDVIVSNNTVKNVKTVDIGWSGPITGAAIAVKDTYEDGVITIENNTIDNVDRGISIYKFTSANATYEPGMTHEESKVVVKENTITDFELFGIGTSTLNYESSSLNTLVEINDNAFDAENALYIGQENSGWTVSATGNKVNSAVNTNVNGEFPKK